MNIRSLVGLGLVVMLSACAQKPVTMSDSFWNDKTSTVAIVIVKAPEASQHQQGAQGLLDVAITNGVAGTLNTHLKTLKFDEFYGIGNDLQARLKGRGLNVVGVYTAYDMPNLQNMKAPQDHKNYALLDFRPLAATLKADRIVLIQPTVTGTVRSYYGFIPLGAPQGAFVANGEIVDLRTDEVLWFHTATPFTVIATPWDEAPDYPNLTDSVFQAMNAARVELLQSFPAQENTPQVAAAVGNK